MIPHHKLKINSVSYNIEVNEKYNQPELKLKHNH